MSTVKCNKGDAPAPKQVGGLLLLGTPFETKFNEGDRLTFKMGVSFDCPVLLMQYPFAVDDGVEILNAGEVVLPGQEVVVTLSKKGETAFFERGRALCCVAPLVSSFELQ